MNILFVDRNSKRRRRCHDLLRGESVRLLEADCILGALQILESQSVDRVLLFSPFEGLDAQDFLGIFPAEDGRPFVVSLIADSASEKNSFFLAKGDEFFLNPMQHEELLALVGHRSKQRSGIHGDLSTMSCFDLLQMLSVTGRSGVLLLEHHDGQSQLHYRDGQIVAASTGGESGEPVLRKLFRQIDAKSRFSFQAEPVISGMVNIHKRTEHLLLEMAQELDEEKQC